MGEPAYHAAAGVGGEGEVMIKTIMVCDQCGKERDSQTAENWIDVKPMGHYVVTFSAAFSSPDIYGLYCSVGCLSEKMSAKREEVSDFVDKIIVTRQGAEYKLT